MIDYKNEEGSKDNMSRLSLKQIEINTISASCFGLSQDKIEKLHRYIFSPIILHKMSLECSSHELR